VICCAGEQRLPLFGKYGMANYIATQPIWQAIVGFLDRAS
jgi:hypothetical protein